MGAAASSAGAGSSLPERLAQRLRDTIQSHNHSGFHDLLLEVHSAQQRRTLCSNILLKGKTLLQYAASRGCWEICLLLLQQSVDINRMNCLPTGGSALHEVASALLSCACPRQRSQLCATFELLLEHGADPFLENASSLTVMDMLQGSKPPGTGSLVSALTGLARGCSTSRRASLLRRVESLGMCAAQIRMQVHPFSSRDWSIMWAVVVPRRYSSPFGSPPRQASPELVAYASSRDLKPLFTLMLDGCKVERLESVVRLLVLPTTKKNFRTSFMTPLRTQPDAGGSSSHAQRDGATSSGELHWAVQLKPLDYSSQHMEAFSALMCTCRRCGGAVPRGDAAEPPAAPALRLSMPPLPKALRPCPSSQRHQQQHSHQDQAGPSSRPSSCSQERSHHGQLDAEQDGWSAPCSSSSAMQHAGGLSSRERGSEASDGAVAVPCLGPEWADEALAPSSNRCVICMDASTEVGFKHGHSVHVCCCYVCASSMLAQAEQARKGGREVPVACPVCRQTVEEVLLAYS